MTEKNAQLGNWHFSLRSLFLWTLFVAVPLGCFCQYYLIVADTVDKRAVPLVNAPGVAIVFLGVGLLTIVLVCIGMLAKRSYKSAIIFMASLLLGVFFGYPLLNASVLRPKQGNQVAELHNDAASLTAMAIKNYYERVGSWPMSWQDLYQDIKAASVTPNALPGSMGMPQRLNLAANLPFDELVNLVDVDFAASPEALAKETWSEFTGIRPHEPSYNLYPVHFQELIDTISASQE
ncbi:MAG: hypothetical protein MUC83_07205 [Pirellula sp.]|nr:hypothetical protein [Pirellula sp.]